MLLEDVIHLIVDHLKARGRGGFFWGEDNAIFNRNKFPVGVEADESVSCGGSTGVNS
jgi:hypothetical protein